MRIGFLAMSGVRVRDEQLMELGLTLPGFVERSRVVASLPSLGLLYLAAVTPPGHELYYCEAEADGAEPEGVYTCDLVAISTFSAQVQEAYAIASRLRERGVVVAMGGLHVSVMPDEARRYADHVIVGEGERVWPAVVEAVESGSPGRIWNAAKYGAVDLGSLPIPRYDLLDERPYNRFTVQTSRGCPWRCDFCASTVMLGLRYRKRPVAHVVRDIQAVRDLRSRPFIEFADDNTFVDKHWGKKLCRALIPLGIKWFTETDITVADDPELLSLMAQAGCRQVLIGLESPDPASLEGVETKANFKAKSASRYLEAIRRIQSSGITVNGCFVLGLDDHTPTMFERVYDFVSESELYEVQITVLTPFPGTPLYDRLLREGRILEPTAWNLCTLFDVNYVPKRMSPDELRRGLHDLAGSLYDADAVKRRRSLFFGNLRRSARRVAHRNLEDLVMAV
ncbi:MAG: B12-binding domain-containing radical SAM protein [Nitrospinota bacterium]